MKVAVVGVGAIGALITYALNLADIEPYLVFRGRDVAKRYSSKGIIIKVNKDKVRLRGIYVSYPDLPNEVDIAFICVKSYDFSTAMRNLINHARVKLCVTCQNGLGSFELANKLVTNGYVAALVLNVGVLRESDGVFKYVGSRVSYLGTTASMYHKIVDQLKDISDILSRVFKVKVVEDINPYRWYKLLINAGLNPVTALLRAPNRVIIENEFAQKVAIEAVNEGVRVCSVLGVKLPSDPIRGLFEVAKATADNYSSMLQDIMRGKRTEIDYINGKIIEYGIRLRLPTPVNNVLYRLVKAIEQSRI